MEIPQLLPLHQPFAIENNRAMETKLKHRQKTKLLHNGPPSVLVLDLQMAAASPWRLFEKIRFITPTSRSSFWMRPGQ
jgi:hypothetical protein